MIFTDFALIDQDLEIKKNVFIKISDDGIINEIYQSENFERKNPLGEGKSVLIPGLINSHTHIADNFGKELGLNKLIKDVVEEPDGLKHKLLKNTNESIIIEGILHAVNDMLSNGITYFIDFREMGTKGVKLLKKALKNSPIGFKVLGRPYENENISEILKMADGIGFPSCSKIGYNQIENLKDKKLITNKIIATHISEIKRDNKILDKILTDDIIDIFIHCTHFTKEDLLNIKKNNKKIVICPQSNGYFSVGIPPIKEMLEMNLGISIGTDNLMAIRPDLFEEMRYLYKVSKIKNPNFQIKSRDLLKMATINAAMNFKLDNEIGSISEGKYANFFLINLNESNYYSINDSNVLDLIVHRTSNANIKKVYIKGKVVFERN